MKLEMGFPLTQLHWWLLAAMLVLGGFVFYMRYLERRRRERVNAFAAADIMPRLLVGYDVSVRGPLFWLALLGLVSFLLALAQPHWGQAWKEVRKHSRDVLICLDTSESMRATDFLPNRLERAKQKIVSLVDSSPGDRFGLVAFSGAAALQCPLTLDHGYFKVVLNAVDTDTISMEGTDIGAAVEEAAKTFEEEDAAANDFNRDTRAILVISDGEQVSGDAIARAEEASPLCRVYVMGVGDPRGAEVSVPEMMAGRRGGADVKHVSKLDEDTLIKVAKAGGGPYVAASADNWDINQVSDAMERLETRAVGSDLRLQLVNRYQWPLAVAILFFAAEGCWLVALPWLRSWRLSREARRLEEAGNA